MTLKQHTDARERFNQQVENSQEYVLPFIAATMRLGAGVRVLEIGCGEGGVLLPFVKAGCYAVGVDLNPERIQLANAFLDREVSAGTMKFIFQNVYDDSFSRLYKGFFHLIVLKDAIEHIPEQEKFIPYIKQFLEKDGQIFFGFPPWYMPFGGHQQVCRNKVASVLPWYHILPKPIYKRILKAFGEHEVVIEELLEIWDTRLTIERFERIVRASDLKILRKQPFLVNPIYKYKFGINAVKQSPLVSALPYVRDFLTTCVYYTVAPVR